VWWWWGGEGAAAVGRRGSGGGFKVHWWNFLARAEEDDVRD
jgi:hypothetical protein